MKEVDKYIEDVLNGERKAGRLEILSVKRHLKIIEDKKYYFDTEAVEHLFYIISLFKHTSGDYYKKPFKLFPWEKFILASIFGTKKKATDKRLYRKAYISVAKKAGKSELAGAIGVIGTFFDNENTAEVYSVANKYDQAKICWTAGKVIAELLAEDSASFEEVVKIYDSFNSREIRFLKDGSFFKPIPSDSKTLDGHKSSISIIDEFHEAKDDDVLRNLSSGMVHRSQPLLFIITTAGFNINGPCHRYESVVTNILENKITDDTTFGLIFRADKDDDWNDPNVWEKSNPSLGITPTLEGIETEYTKALNEGQSAEVNFKTKNLNQWVRSSETWVSDSVLQKGQSEWDISHMEGRECYVAWDMSITSDITGVGLLFPPDSSDQSFHFYCNYFCPKENAVKRSKKDRVPYLDWEKNENFTLTPGDWVDYEFVEEHIKSLTDRFIVKSIAYDQWQSERLAQALIKEGAPCVKFPQTTRNFNEPIKFLEKAFGEGRIDFGNDVILRWMAGNVVIYRDATGLMKFDKRFSREKIDGMVILAMCIGEYLDDLGEDGEKPYESHGVRFL